MTTRLPSLPEAKSRAKALRQSLSEEGQEISHAQALERIAHDYGFRDWNTCHAAIRDTPPVDWSVGARVTGRYLAQPFEATVVSSRVLESGWVRLALDLDKAVDVVRFDSFSNPRKRVQCVVGPSGTTREKTSDGKPHVVLDM